MATSNLQFVITAEDEASSKFKDFQANALQAGAALTTIGAGITAAMYKIVDAASDAQVQISQFNTIIQDSKGGSEAVKEALEAQADANTKLAFDDQDSAISLGLLFQKTGNVTEAIKDNTLAMNIAREKNIDLASATKIVLNALNGSEGGLVKLGLAAKGTKDPLSAIDQAMKNTAGQAEAFAKTNTGASEALSAAFNQFEVALGQTLLPVIQQFLGYATNIIITITKWAETHQTLVKNILIGVGVFGAVLLVLGSVLVVVGGLTAAFGAAAAATVAWVAVAIAALIAAAALVVTNWTAVKNFFIKMWDDLEILFQKGVAAVMNYLQPLINAIQTVQNGLGKVAGAVGGAISSAGNYIAGHLAAGGPAMGGSTYLVGENGPELFTPSVSGVVSPNGSFGGGTVINITGTFLSDDAAGQLGNMIIRQLQRAKRISA